MKRISYSRFFVRKKKKSKQSAFMESQKKKMTTLRNKWNVTDNATKKAI